MKALLPILIFISSLSISSNKANAKGLNAFYIGAGAGYAMNHRAKPGLSSSLSSIDTTALDQLQAGSITTDQAQTNIQNQLEDKITELQDGATITNSGALMSLNIGLSKRLLYIFYLGVEGSYYFTPGVDRQFQGGLSYGAAAHFGFTLGPSTAAYMIGGIVSALVPEGDVGSVTTAKQGVQLGFGLKGVINKNFTAAVELTSAFFDVNSSSAFAMPSELDGMRNIYAAQLKFAYNIL